MTRLSFFILTALLGLLASNNAAALTLAIPDDFKTQPVGSGIEYLPVADKNKTINEIRGESGWGKVTNQHPGFGFDDRVYWLKFDLLNEHTQPHDLLVALPNSYLDEIDLYVLDQKGNIRTHQKSGDHREMRARPISHPENIHPLILPAGERLSVYIRINSRSSLSIPIQLWEQDAYLTFDYRRTVALGIFLGLMIMFSLYHLVIAAITRDSSAYFYTVFVFSVFVVFAYRKGVPASLPAAAWIPSTETASILAMGFTGFSLCFFTSKILRLKQAIPKLAGLMHAAGILALAPILAYLFLDYSLVIRLSLGYSLLLIGLYALVVIRRLIDGYPPAKPMVIASIFGVTGNGLGILSSIDLVPFTFSIEAIIYTSNALMALFFALTLSYRINLDRMLLEETQRQHTHELDELVREQTDELEKVNEELRIVSITDGLTGLYNRRHFDDMLKTSYNRAFREKSSLAMLLIDIDHFKQLNDTYGHSFGDFCLEKIGEVIRGCVRRPRDMSARYGGEEFVILLPDTELPGALHIAETLHKAIAATSVKDDDIETSMTVSIGVAAEVPEQPDQHETLLQRADHLLYKAKHGSRNRVEGGVHLPSKSSS